MRSRASMWCWAVLVAVVLCVPPAGAASSSSRQIYADFAAHGRLDGRYSRAELEAALRDALAEGYSAPAASGVKPVVEVQLHAAQLHAEQLHAEQLHAEQLHAGASGSSLPFTGADLALIALGAGTLLLLGAGLRRVGRTE